jgi:hypothetical protein
MRLISPRPIDTKRNEPDPEGIRQAFSRIGYRLEEALADLIDNSIDAGARHVLVRLFRSADAVERVVVADDGAGIKSNHIDECMQFGARLNHRTSDRGKYGIGLKSASFSQARSLSLVSRNAGRVVGRRWTVDSIRNGWLCEVLDARDCKKLLDGDWEPAFNTEHGTLVVWDQIDRIRAERGSIDPTINRIFRTLPIHLGMVFHRFLADGRLALTLDSLDLSSGMRGLPYDVHALNPFGSRRTGRQGYPRDLQISTEGYPVTLHCHIWPPKATEPEYKLGGKVADRQGFYFYRNDRLIQAGGWNGWRDEESEPHLSLARVRVELPTALDAAFGLNVQKWGVDAGPGFRRLLDAAEEGGWSLRSYVRDADATYRNAEPASREAPIVPGAGLPPMLRRFVTGYLADGKVTPRSVPIQWRILPAQEVFRIDREPPRLILNRRYREAMAAGEDGAVVKLLGFLILREEFGRERVRSARAEWLKALNRMLLMALAPMA